MTNRPLTANIYFNPDYATWWKDTIGDFCYVEKDGVRTIYTDFFHTDITGVTELEQELIDNKKVIYLGKISLEEYSMYLPRKYSEIWEKDA
jgi:hypothetical protein